MFQQFRLTCADPDYDPDCEDDSPIPHRQKEISIAITDVQFQKVIDDNKPTFDFLEHTYGILDIDGDSYAIGFDSYEIAFSEMDIVFDKLCGLFAPYIPPGAAVITRDL